MEKFKYSLTPIKRRIERLVCQYRSILDVFSKEWTPLHQIKNITFVEYPQEISKSTMQEGNLLVFTTLLNQWMCRIRSQMKDMQKDFMVVP